MIASSGPVMEQLTCRYSGYLRKFIFRSTGFRKYGRWVSYYRRPNMTNYWALISLILCLFGCGQSNNSKNNSLTNQSKIPVYTSAITVISFDTTQTWIFKDCRSSELNSIEIENIEILLAKCNDDFNLKEEKHFEELSKKNLNINFDKNNFVIDLKKTKGSISL
jgi:hypothetical protein